MSRRAWSQGLLLALLAAGTALSPLLQRLGTGTAPTAPPARDPALLEHAERLVRRLEPTQEIVCLPGPGEAPDPEGKPFPFLQVDCKTGEGEPLASLDWDWRTAELVALSRSYRDGNEAGRALSEVQASQCAVQWLRRLDLLAEQEEVLSVRLRVRTEHLLSFRVVSRTRRMRVSVDRFTGELVLFDVPGHSYGDAMRSQGSPAPAGPRENDDPGATL